MCPPYLSVDYSESGLVVVWEDALPAFLELLQRASYVVSAEPLPRLNQLFSSLFLPFQTLMPMLHFTVISSCNQEENSQKRQVNFLSPWKSKTVLNQCLSKKRIIKIKFLYFSQWWAIFISSLWHIEIYVFPIFFLHWLPDWEPFTELV